MVDSSLDGVAVFLNPSPFVIGHVFHIEAAVQRIAEDGLHTVVGSHQDEAVLRGEHVHVSKTGFGRNIHQIG